MLANFFPGCALRGMLVSSAGARKLKSVCVHADGLMESEARSSFYGCAFRIALSRRMELDVRL